MKEPMSQLQPPPQQEKVSKKQKKKIKREKYNKLNITDQVFKN